MSHKDAIDANWTGAHIAVNAAGVSSTSRGLVGDTVFAVIPNITPLHTFTITLAFQTVRSAIVHPLVINRDT